LVERLPRAEILLTLGAQGVMYHSPQTDLSVPAPKVATVDTTAAGDTFIGYYVAGQAAGLPVQKCLRIACHAAAICVSRPGAMDSIPRKEEVLDIADAM
jgi:ribokinase